MQHTNVAQAMEIVTNQNVLLGSSHSPHANSLALIAPIALALSMGWGTGVQAVTHVDAFWSLAHVRVQKLTVATTHTWLSRT